MNMNINLGKDFQGNDIWIDLYKENIHTIFLTGSTGTGKGILHLYIYKQLMENNSPNELGFVFMDMTRLDFVSWKTPFLHIPVIVDEEKSFKTFKELANYNGGKTIFIHIEECDMVVQHGGAFEEIWEKIHKNKNIYIIFSTSRPSMPDVFTFNIKMSTDMIITFQLSSYLDSRWVLGRAGAEKFISPGEKNIFYKNKEILSVPFDEDEIKKIKEFDKSMFNS